MQISAPRRECLQLQCADESGAEVRRGKVSELMGRRRDEISEQFNLSKYLAAIDGGKFVLV